LEIYFTDLAEWFYDEAPADRSVDEIAIDGYFSVMVKHDYDGPWDEDTGVSKALDVDDWLSIAKHLSDYDFPEWLVNGAYEQIEKINEAQNQKLNRRLHIGSPPAYGLLSFWQLGEKQTLRRNAQRRKPSLYEVEWDFLQAIEKDMNYYLDKAPTSYSHLTDRVRYIKLGRVLRKRGDRSSELQLDMAEAAQSFLRDYGSDFDNMVEIDYGRSTPRPGSDTQTVADIVIANLFQPTLPGPVIRKQVEIGGEKRPVLIASYSLFDGFIRKSGTDFDFGPLVKEVIDNAENYASGGKWGRHTVDDFDEKIEMALIGNHLLFEIAAIGKPGIMKKISNREPIEYDDFSWIIMVPPNDYAYYAVDGLLGSIRVGEQIPNNAAKKICDMLYDNGIPFRSLDRYSSRWSLSDIDSGAFEFFIPPEGILTDLTFSRMVYSQKPIMVAYGVEDEELINEFEQSPGVGVSDLLYLTTPRN